MTIRMKARTQNEKQSELSLQCSDITPCEKVIISMSQMLTNHIFLLPFMSVESSKLFTSAVCHFLMGMAVEGLTFIGSQEKGVISVQWQTVFLSGYFALAPL